MVQKYPIAVTTQVMRSAQDVTSKRPRRDVIPEFEKVIGPDLARDGPRQDYSAAMPAVN